MRRMSKICHSHTSTALPSAELQCRQRMSLLLLRLAGTAVYLDVVHPIQQGNLVAGGLYLAGNALVLSEERGVPLHVWGRIGKLRDLQSVQDDYTSCKTMHTKTLQQAVCCSCDHMQHQTSGLHELTCEQASEKPEP